MDNFILESFIMDSFMADSLTIWKVLSRLHFLNTKFKLTEFTPAYGSLVYISVGLFHLTDV